MKRQNKSVLSEEEIEAREGGQGSGRIKTIAQALAKPETYPGRWFNSGQIDTLFYNEHEYLYSLWWACKNFSGKYYDYIATEEQGEPIGDVGGSIFSSLQLAKGHTGVVMISNLDGTPQSDFSWWLIEKLKLYRFFILDTPSNVIRDACNSIVMKAYLEHFVDVSAEVKRWVTPKCRAAKKLYVANSFCETSYGHYIPINIDGVWTNEQEKADETFNLMMEVSYGYDIEKLDFQPKSKLWRFTR